MKKSGRYMNKARCYYIKKWTGNSVYRYASIMKWPYGRQNRCIPKKRFPDSETLKKQYG
jgi:hypothetical protein